MTQTLNPGDIVGSDDGEWGICMNEYLVDPVSINISNNEGGDISLTEENTGYTYFISDNHGLTHSSIRCISKPISEPLTACLHEFCHHSDIATYCLLLAAVAYVASRWTDNHRVILGMPAFRLEETSVTQVLAAAIEINDVMPVGRYLNEAKHTIQQIVQNNQRFYDFITGEQTAEDRLGKFKIIVNSEAIQDKIPNMAVTDQVVFNLKKNEDSLLLELLYNESQYYAETANLLLKKLVRVIEQLITNTNISLGDLEWIGQEEEKRLSYFNNTEEPFPSERPVHTFFEEWAAKAPLHCAVKFEGVSYTYGDINQRANQLARKLAARQIGPGCLVAICMERSPELIIGILGILKAGAAYVPIDPHYPQKRIDSILEDTASSILLTAGTIRLVSNGTVTVLNLTEDTGLFIGEDDNLCERCLPTDGAYVIYTSGSSGKSKGVLVEHRSLVNRLIWMQRRFPMSSSDVFLQKTTYCFDVSVWELLLWSFLGATLVLLPAGAEKRPDAIAKAIEDNHVTVIHFVPTMLEMFTAVVREKHKENMLKSLRYIFCSGEALMARQVRHFYALFGEECPKLINKYGPTEAAIDVTYYECDRHRIPHTIPIGRPISNISIAIVSKQGKIQGLGAVGEICISGVGVARGYLNRPELTGEKYVRVSGQRGGVFYRTGDLARWDKEGNIEYLGRNDHQVKIKGYRIELGEIETVLYDYLDIQENAAVVSQDQEGLKEITVFYMAKNAIEKENLDRHVRRYLPEYMLPVRYIKVDVMPHLFNGKIDRKQLSVFLTDGRTGEDSQRPKERIESAVYDIFSDILKTSGFSPSASFFTLGGDSIKAIRAVSRINLILKTELTLLDLYDHNSVVELAVHIKNGAAEPVSLRKVYEFLEEQKKELVSSISDHQAVDAEDIYPVSDIQMGMILQSLLAGAKGIYHDQHVVEFADNHFQLPLMEKALDWMVKKHSILRTTYSLTQFPRPMQIVCRHIKTAVCFTSLTANTPDEQTQNIQEYMKEDRERPFIESENVIASPLWRLAVFQLSASGRFLIVFSVHHSILDGWSVASFFSELTNVYDRQKSEPSAEIPVSSLAHSYRDYIAEQLSLEADEKTMQFWNNELEQAVPYEFPTIETKADMISNVRGVETYTLGDQKNGQVRELASLLGVSPKSICFAAYAYMLYMASYTTSFIVGLVDSNRPNCTDADKILGCFLNTLPVRYTFQKGIQWVDFIWETDQKLLNLKRFGRIPAPAIIQRIKSPVPANSINNFFNYVDFHIYEEMKPRLQTARKLDIDEVYQTEIPLDFICVQTQESFFIKICYQSNRIGQDQIKRYCQYYEKILEVMVAEPYAVISKTRLHLAIGYHLSPVCREPGKHSGYDNFLDCFFDHAAGHGDVIALRYQERSITYKDLDKMSDSIAAEIQNRDIPVDSPIAVLLDRSPEVVICIVGILKAGCCYVPIDTALPPSRIRYILDDSNCSLVLTSQSNPLCIGDQALAIQTIDFNKPAVKLNRKIGKDTPAYIIYTSGSTGRPKGAIIDHGALWNFIESMKDDLPLKRETTFLSITTMSFDIFVLESLVPLSCLMTVYLASRSEQLNPQEIAAILTDNPVSFMQSTPSRLGSMLLDQNMCRAISSLEALVIGGEKVTEGLKNKLFSEGVKRIFHMYGPTETTVWSTVKELAPDEQVVLGAPIRNTVLVILDSGNELQAMEAHGELCIGGSGLARGYCNDLEITNRQFIRAPYDTFLQLYKTGDMVRRENGEYIFEGRLDNQVKIRGYRIEPGEIEQTMEKSLGVDYAVVIPFEEGCGNWRLYAFYTAAEPQSEKVMRVELLRELPDYMVPARFLYKPEFPFLPSGKIDKKALADGISSVTDDRESKPENKTHTEKVITDIWEKALRRKNIGIMDNFFELGGDSLLLVSVYSEIAGKLSEQITIADLFSNATIAALAKRVDHLLSAKERLLLRTGLQLEPSFYGTEQGKTTALSLKKERWPEKIEKKWGSVDILLVFLTGYIYMLHELTPSKKISVLAESSGVCLIHVNFDEIEDWKDLYGSIREQYNPTDMNEIGITPMNAPKSVIYPVFTFNDGKLRSRIPTNLKDLSLTCVNRHSHWEIFLEFDSGILHKERMRKFLSGYSRILDIVSNKLQKGE